MSSHCATGDWEDEIARINLFISTTGWKVTGPITFTIHYNTQRYMNELARTCGIHITNPNLPSDHQTILRTFTS